MGGTGDALREFLAQAATFLGLKATEVQQLEKTAASLRAEKRRCQDRIDDLKDDVGRLEGLARRKKREMDAAGGHTRRLLERELKQVLRELGGMREKEDLWFRRSENATILIQNLEAIQAGKDEGIDIEDLATDLVLEKEETVATQKVADQAVDDLAKVKYDIEEREDIDLDQAMAELDGPPAESSTLSEEEKKLLLDIDRQPEPE